MFDRIRRMVTDFLSGLDRTLSKTPRVIPASEHGIDPKLVPFSAKRTCELLQNRGFKAYIVGGAVRDLLLGATPKDFDVATDATPQQVKRIQRRAFIIGKRFRLVHVVFGQEIIECSTFRALDADGVRKDAQGRVVSDNVFGEMWEDAARRDFTVNALYYDPMKGDVFDYHHGWEDLQRKRLRMIGDPEERYREDPVRMMRAVRIAAKLGFTMEAATEKAIPKMAGLLANVPAARLFDEMMKLFTSGHAEECLIGLRKEGLHRSLLPMLDVILSEPDGEKFLMLALKRTDERIASGKKISPAFMFCTLLWPQVVKRWEAYEVKQGMKRAEALFAASNDVIATQCSRLAIHNRFVEDMKLIWMMQLRFERRTGKNPFTLVKHLKYRAAYDFLLLRSLLGHVPADLVQWWDTFAYTTPDEQVRMVRAVEQQARQTAEAAREGSRRKKNGRRCRGSERFEEAPKTSEVPAVTSPAAKTEEPLLIAKKPEPEKITHEAHAMLPHERTVLTSEGETLVQVETRRDAAETDEVKPARRRRTKKAADVKAAVPEKGPELSENAPVAETPAAAPEAAAPEAPAEKPAAPKKRVVRRKKAVEAAADTVAEKPAGTPAEPAPEAPVKKRAVRRKTVKTEGEAAGAAPASEEAAPEAAVKKTVRRCKKAEPETSDTVAEEKPKRRRTVKKTETPEAQPEATAAEEVPAKTVRKRRTKTADDSEKTGEAAPKKRVVRRKKPVEAEA